MVFRVTIELGMPLKNILNESVHIYTKDNPEDIYSETDIELKRIFKSISTSTDV